MPLHPLRFADITPLHERPVSRGLGHVSSRADMPCLIRQRGIRSAMGWIMHACMPCRRMSGLYAFRWSCAARQPLPRLVLSRHTAAPLPRSCSAASLGTTQSLSPVSGADAAQRPGAEGSKGVCRNPRLARIGGLDRAWPGASSILPASAAATARREPLPRSLPPGCVPPRGLQQRPTPTAGTGAVGRCHRRHDSQSIPPRRPRGCRPGAGLGTCGSRVNHRAKVSRGDGSTPCGTERGLDVVAGGVGVL